MYIPERKYLGRPYMRPLETLYDYEVCADKEALAQLLDEINCRRYQITAVTQDTENRYTVIFLKANV